MRVFSVMSVFRCGFLRGPLAALGLMMLFSAAVFAQQPEPEATPPPDDPTRPVTVRTDLVTLTLTVTDLYGRYVSGLSKNSFRVFDNNQEQTITFFSDSDSPVSVGVLFDVSGSMTGKDRQGPDGTPPLHRGQPPERRVFPDRLQQPCPAPARPDPRQ